ncbi:MAG: TraX family protein [Erysipelotrichaceae bacterium]
MKNILSLNANQLKIIAAISMLIDHIGYLLFPNVIFLRIIGRISFPIFAYFIYIGMKYTRNEKDYFLRMFIAGIIMMIFTYLFGDRIWGNIMITFSCSIALIIPIKRYLKEQKLIYLLQTILVMIGAVFLSHYTNMDYGVIGSSLPVIAYIFDDGKNKNDINYKALIAFVVGLIVLASSVFSVQYFSLLALPFLLCYNGRKGKLNLKYFFYLFYPLHYLLLLLISQFITFGV